MIQLWLYTGCNHNCLLNIIPEKTIELIRECKNLINLFSWYVPHTINDEDYIISQLERYREIQHELKNTICTELIPKISKPPILVSPNKISKKCKKRTHVHSLIKHYEAPTQTLLNENSNLIHKLYTCDLNNIEEMKSVFEQYNKVQEKLRLRDVNSSKFELHVSTREKILLLLGNKCSSCGSLQNLTLHHIKAKKDGGTNSIDNLQVLCRDCHDTVHNITHLPGFKHRIANHKKKSNKARKSNPTAIYLQDYFSKIDQNGKTCYCFNY